MSETPAGSAPASRLMRWLPGLAGLQDAVRASPQGDLVAGLVLSAMLVPVGMGYAEASGLPAITGLYATLVPLLVYALVGPSRVLVLGPDSTLSAVIAAVIGPLAAGQPERAMALAGLLAVLSGAFLLLMGLARLGLLADLLSKPIRIGFMNAIALTVIVGQVPKLLGLAAQGDSLPAQLQGLLQGLAGGQVPAVAAAVGLGSLAVMLALRRWRPGWPAVLLAMVAVTALSAALDLGARTGLAVLGPLPQGLPALALPSLAWADVKALLPGAAMIALLSFADTSVLSRAMAQPQGRTVDQDQEMRALGLANIATGFFQGFPISSSASRTPVAASAGARSPLAGLVGAAVIAALLLGAPGLLRHLPAPLLAAVVIFACLSFADLRGMAGLWRMRRLEFGLSLTSFVGVALVGVIEGIVITVVLALLVLVWNTWHPYAAVLVRVDGRKGYHDLQRHPEGRQVPGLVIFRWDAPLFFANAEIFRHRVLQALAASPTPALRLVVAADAITDIDITAAESLDHLHDELQRRGVVLHFGGLKGPVKDRLAQYGLLGHIGADCFEPTVGSAVQRYRQEHAVDWKDWDEP